MGSSENHKHHEERTKIFFWFTAFVTLGHLVNLTMEVFGRGPVSLEMTVFYLSVLSLYSGPNAVVRWKKEKGNRPGEVIAMVVCFYAAVVYFFAVYYKTPESVPEQLHYTWGGVLLVLFGTRMPKMIRDIFFSEDRHKEE